RQGLIDGVLCQRRCRFLVRSGGFACADSPLDLLQRDYLALRRRVYPLGGRSPPRESRAGTGCETHFSRMESGGDSVSPRPELPRNLRGIQPKTLFFLRG